MSVPAATTTPPDLEPTTGPGSDVCAIATAPGPDDEPSRTGGDLMDNSDFGGGRWRYCLEEPMVLSIEHSAWCTWNADRTRVVEVTGLPARAGPVRHDVSIDLVRRAFQWSTTDATGTVATYEPAGTVAIQLLDDDGGAGVGSFQVALMPDPNGELPLPVGFPGRFGGVLRWQCGDPPPAP
jgi:hypothetical protein